MKRGSWAKVCALIVLAVAGMLLAPGCDVLGLGTCDTSGGGGAGGGGDVGGGGGDVGGGGGDYLGGGCTPTPLRTCTDMFDACQDKGKPCTRVIEGSSTLCGLCLRDCADSRPYRYAECYKCGFNDL
jgi:hypothetical protein